jgi:translation initiation factor 2 subunit 1
LYIGAPKYRISVTASDFKSAEKTLKPILEDIQKNIEKNKGSFKFTREESRKTGGE